MPFRAPDSERHDRVMAALRSSELDGFLCSLPSQILMLTGYWPVMAASVGLFTADAGTHLAIPQDEEEIAKASSSAELATFRTARLDEITGPQKAAGDVLIQLFKKLKLGSARIGIESGQCVQPCPYVVMNLYLSGLHELLKAEFPNLQLIASGRLFENLKATKTKCELERIRVAARLAGAAFDSAEAQIEPGMREPEVASRFQSAFEETPLAAAVQRSYGTFFCMSGPNSAKAHAAYARTRQRIIQEGDLVMIHCNTCADGFWTDVTRTYIAGKPDSRQEEMRSAIMEARHSALKSIKPGVEAKDVDLAARSVLDRKNFGKEFKHSTGHGVGFSAANSDGVPRIHPKSRDTLTMGMSFNIEPAIYIDDYGGMRHCDMVGITEQGAEVFSDF